MKIFVFGLVLVIFAGVVLTRVHAGATVAFGNIGFIFMAIGILRFLNEKDD